MPDDSSSWIDLIGESVYTSDDQDIGDIEAVSRNFIVVKKGLVNVHDTISLFTGLKVGTAT